MARRPANANYVVTANIVDQIQKAAAEGVAGAANGVQAIAAAFASNVGNREDVKRAHRRIGDRMIEATLNAYDTRVGSGSKERDSPARFKGKLRPALADSRQIRADARGISFVNIAIMRSRARHYRRLNWGAEGYRVEDADSPSFQWTLFGTPLGRVSFNQTARPAFQLPPGLFFGPTVAGGRSNLPRGTKRAAMNERHRQWSFPHPVYRNTGGVFYPLGELPRGTLTGRVAAAKMAGRFNRPTAGIKPQYFLEEGLRQFTEALPQEYDLLVRSWMAKGTKAGQAYLANLKIRGGTSRIRDFSKPSLRVTA